MQDDEVRPVLGDRLRVRGEAGEPRARCTLWVVREFVDRDHLTARTDGEEILGRRGGQGDDPGRPSGDGDAAVRGLDRDREELWLRGRLGRGRRRAEEDEDRRDRRDEQRSVDHEKTSAFSGGGWFGGSAIEPPFLRGLAFVGMEQASWLVPRRGFTVAGQRRACTGLRCLHAGRGYVPGGVSLPHSTLPVRGAQEALRGVRVSTSCAAIPACRKT